MLTEVYARRARRELDRLSAELNPELGTGGGTGIHQELIVKLRGLWAPASPDGSSLPLADRIVNYNVNLIALPQRVGTAPKLVAPTDGYARLSHTMDLIRDLFEKVDDKKNADRVAAVFKARFGDKHWETGQARFRQMDSTLRSLWRRTKPGFTQPAKSGFVLSAALPRNVGALAQVGGYVSVRPSFLTADTPPADLLTTLVHEATHLGDQRTSDYAYRPTDAMTVLPPEIAVDNAAHYEELVLDLIVTLGLKESVATGTAGRVALPDPRAVTGDVHRYAAALVQIKAARAWIRAMDLTRSAPEQRQQVAQQLGVDESTLGKDVTDMVFDDLVDLTGFVHQAAQQGITLISGGTEVERQGSRFVVGVPNNVTSLHGLVTCTLTALYGKVVTHGLPAVAQYADDIVKYDRTHERTMLARFL